MRHSARAQSRQVISSPDGGEYCVDRFKEGGGSSAVPNQEKLKRFVQNLGENSALYGFQRTKIKNLGRVLRNADSSTLANLGTNAVFVSIVYSSDELSALEQFAGQMSSSKEKKQKSTALPQWFIPYTKLSDEELDIDKISDLVGDIEDRMEQGKGQDLTAIFQGFDVKDIPPVTLVTLLRMTSPFRKSLAGWTDFLKRVDQELKRKGLDSDKTLWGLK